MLDLAPRLMFCFCCGQAHAARWQRERRSAGWRWVLKATCPDCKDRAPKLPFVTDYDLEEDKSNGLHRVS